MVATSMHANQYEKSFYANRGWAKNQPKKGGRRPMMEKQSKFHPIKYNAIYGQNLKFQNPTMSLVRIEVFCELACGC